MCRRAGLLPRLLHLLRVISEGQWPGASPSLRHHLVSLAVELLAVDATAEDLHLLLAATRADPPPALQRRLTPWKPSSAPSGEGKQDSARGGRRKVSDRGKAVAVAAGEERA
jgi:hypothetical protein